MIGTGVNLAHGTISLLCPEDMTATWAGAAFGKTTKFNRNMVRFRVLNEPTKHLACVTDPSPVGDKLTVVVQLSPGAIPALCGGRANISGLAPTAGSVPPFGGFPFKSGRIDAVPTYNQSTGRCQLDLPIRGLVTSIDVNKTCKPVFDNVWDCPDLTSPVSALFDPGTNRFASASQTQSPEIFRVLSTYGAFAPSPLSAARLPWQAEANGPFRAAL